ncbi:AlpA family transcriptional regulator [Desulfoprunum benzoelyticum]|uniref:Putative DNA-binding transcriptional regulator AlpA n=1 Tax=Desulfoprunum benzoelyticum TaxID=1506996 RepID=A0A840UTV1_9BACT|nr:putative DNA-binding transcriptional regulator AlpA [Desulfoprunum benzoelyticum]MBM9529541.1 AlpA family transcriptional regulator [Desulfoprunum benzoelyticum]
MQTLPSPDKQTLPKHCFDRILRKPEVLSRSGLSDPTIWRMEKAGKFPRRVRLGGNSCGWFESEFDAWLNGLAASRELDVAEA